MSFANGLESVQEDLMGFFDVDSSKGKVKDQIIAQFEQVFKREYGRYGRSYVLRDFGRVIVGRGRLVQEEVYLEGELEELAEKAFE
jgi:hypothetical protein